jgi:peptide deformylase
MILTVAESRTFLNKPTVDCDPTGDEAKETIAALLAEAKQLEETLTDYRVAGLAANQIGHNISAAIMRITPDSDDFTACINPSILYHLAPDATVSNLLDMAVSVEGCYSHPGEHYAVRRHNLITLAYFDLNGDTHTLRLAGIQAVIAQHEVDHLNGDLISDIGKKVQPAVVPSKT